MKLEISKEWAERKAREEAGLDPTTRSPDRMRFRKKPVVIEAVRWRGFSSNLGITVEPVDMPVEITEENMHNVRWAPLPDWLPKPLLTRMGHCLPGEIRRDGENLAIGTLEGEMRAEPGDWIIRGVKGEVYPCKSDVFAATYEPA